ncbi:MAG: pitrilysin family protein [Myxococcota bacterium]|nr:pitrilysin family protein [Myxococcota bacterium]
MLIKNDFFESAAKAASENTGISVRYESSFVYRKGLEAARFLLENGLTIIFMPDARAPLFAYQTWFKVGSRDEDPHRTGLAHLFEHLMFKGTKLHPTGELDRVMESLGSQTNAATWVDWTFYMETLANRPGNLETVIGFEADRMANLILDEETFRSELEVVKNERRLVVDDSPMGTMSETLFKTAFHEHSYRWPTIGYMEHLDATSVEELRDFYRRNYAPNNATVVVVGDLDATEFLSAVAQGYAHLEAQPLTRRGLVTESPQGSARRVELELGVSAPQLLFGYRAPAQSDESYAALELLCEVLVSGESSRLYRRLVIEEKLALDVHGYVAPFAHPGLFELAVQGRPGVDVERLVAVVEEELARASEGLTESEWSKARNNLELSQFLSLKDAEGCAESLGHFETNYGDYRLAFQCLERQSAVSDAQLSQVAEQVFARTNQTLVVAMPREEAIR